jgi:hypothetical protein
VEFSAVKWDRPRGRALVGIAAGLAALVATVVLAVARAERGGSAPLPLAAISTLGHLSAIGAPGPVGPEGVTSPVAPPLARTRRVAPGEQIDGITCEANEQVLFHIHAHLTIFVRGFARQVPGGIGISRPYEEVQTRQGPFVSGASCFMWLHTHASDGIIHTESPITRTYSLGDLFDIWGQRLDGEHVGPAHGTVTAFLNGHVFTGSPRIIPLLPHAQIQLDVGRPLIAPVRITFPTGL